MAARYPHPLIAREGWPFLAAVVLAAVLVGWLAGGWWAAPLWLAALFVLQFFRDPPREIPDDPDAVLSAADGRVVAVEKARDPWLERDALKISVFMNVFNVHSNRAPVDATVKKRWYHAGGFFNAALDKASDDNERQCVRLSLADGRDLAVVQIAGLVARRIVCDLRDAQTVRRGERFGLIRFGSRTDVYLPPGVAPLAALGQRMVGGETVIAELEDGRRPRGGEER